MATVACVLQAISTAVLLLRIPFAHCQQDIHRRWSTAVVPECGEKKIAVLDLAEFAYTAGIPSCRSEEDFKVVQALHGISGVLLRYTEACCFGQVNVANGIVYSTRLHTENLDSHMLGTHAAPWFLGKALRSSSHYAADWQEADIIYVDDYCLYTKWLADVHSFGRDQATMAGQALDLAYDNLLASPRWQVNKGADFVFYDAHPGYRAGVAAGSVQTKVCHSFINATMLIVDTPMRNVCPTFFQMSRIIVTPYAPNTLGSSTPDHLALPPTVFMSERQTLLYSRAQCSHRKTGNAGRSMRWFFSQHVSLNQADVDMECTNHDLGGTHVPFAEMFTSMSHSRFCMALPGDAASTRRLSELMLSGCIPVFPGPPYHSMPFSEQIDWRAAGVFFNITDYTPWSDEKLEFKLSPDSRSIHETEARWWVPDAPVLEALVPVATAFEVS